MGSAGLMVTSQGVAAGLGVAFLVGWTRRVNRRQLLTLLLALLAIGVAMAMRIVPEKHAGRAAAVVMWPGHREPWAVTTGGQASRGMTGTPGLAREPGLAVAVPRYRPRSTSASF